jgi:N-acetylmuramoyl-L-alanine amidase
VIVHHSAGPEHTTVTEIIAEHRRRGFRTIGYHVLLHRVAPGGRWTVSDGRPLSEVGAHDEGQNTGSIGVCIAGRYHLGPVDPAGWDLLVLQVALLCALHDLGADAVEGHREHEPSSSPTACPGFDPALLRAAVAEQLRRVA